MALQNFTYGDIIHLNVGGTRFSTSKQTLTWIPDSFFTTLINGQIPTSKDDTGAIFIDRDPFLFSVILNYLRSKRISLKNVDISSLFHEAEFYGITPLLKQLLLCEEVAHSSCGDVLFYNYLASSDCQDTNVQAIRGHHDWIAVAYLYSVTCYRMKNSEGCYLCFRSPKLEASIEQIALKASHHGTDACFLGIATADHYIRFWVVYKDHNHYEIGISTDHVFFINNQLVCLSHKGKVGIWHANSRHWQLQDVNPISSYDAAGSILLLGCSNGSIYHIDPLADDITAISVYLAPHTSKKEEARNSKMMNSLGMQLNRIEIAYGTRSGTVRVIVQHPESVGYGPQLFETFTVHRHAVIKIQLSEKYLISVCSESNHIRSWMVTRFRGMLSTQPGSLPVASYKIATLDVFHSHSSTNSCGPYGKQDEEQVFIQKVTPYASQLLVRAASTGKRICTIKSVDGTSIRSFCLHECEASSRMACCSHRFLLTGHSNGSVQIWDLTKALDIYYKSSNQKEVLTDAGPSNEELFKFMEHYDHDNSCNSSPIKH